MLAGHGLGLQKGLGTQRRHHRVTLEGGLQIGRN